MKVTAQLVDNVAARRGIRRSAADIVRRKAGDAGSEMVKSANRKMNAQFDTNRPGSRRRHPGSTRASSALGYTVDGVDFPITLRYRVSGGDTVVARLIFMNYGTRAHQITPSGAWGNRGASSVPPRPHTRNVPPRLAWFEDGQWKAYPLVNHPGQGGTNFLEEARDEAVARYLTS